ncbi:spore coat protein [Pseudoflavonifractor phocaeensis]|uniref:spore coat protein n=1 Tax=Pseudoflavonifractor phocaeensis TaxID=1870988 RepID=UPI001F308B5F|nr:spore coat protein [Pseudoflavonifractor phocaeensis]MCF2596138.1 spore coat protein [Pseudoflavonifractor phocaeensis]MDY3906255.1 spore coat protein [Lawsonibacter sp.]
MNDQERLTDFLCSEKKMSANYDAYAAECVSTNLRDDYLKIFNQGHMTQTDLFKLAQAKGWYQVEQAPANKVSQAYTKFSNQQPSN